MTEPHDEIERIGDDFTLEGDVLPDDDVQFADIEANAPDDAALIDDVISGYEHTSTATDQDISALAQGALFLLDQDVRAKVVRARIGLHPSAQNISKVGIDSIADRIIRAYREEVKGHKQSQKNLDHDVSIAVIRNMDHLDDKDLARIAETLGHDKDYFKPKPRPVVEDEVRERDTRER